MLKYRALEETMTKFDLETNEGANIRIDSEYLKPYKEELLEFLDGLDYMRTLKFARSMMISQEIKSNNVIEGIKDDLSIIDKVITQRKDDLSQTERQRIINLYHGYQYILTHKKIDKDSLKELYQLLSENILDSRDKIRMGEYYRTAPVYIIKGNRLDIEPYMGMNENKIEYHMDQLFDFINNDILEETEIDKFVKSQIMHFYFVYIHPYFDVNGRTSRTVAMWYLLNNKNYPYIIFNRAIAFNKKNYEPNIIKGRAYGDITLFIKHMLTSVEQELEKEYLIHNIEENTKEYLSKENLQILEYILTINGKLTTNDLVTIYNKYNQKISTNQIYEEKIYPLIDKKIILNRGYTKNGNNKKNRNMFISLNKEIIDVDRTKIKHLDIDKYI
jgi:Fic family protein